MVMRRAVWVAPVGLMLTWLTLSGCQQLLQLNDYEIEDNSATTSVPAYVCRSHSDCPGATELATATFCSSKHRCVALRNEDCAPLTGAELDPDAILLGSMFETSGADGPEELARQRAVQLAVEEINLRGGIPARGRVQPRSLLLIGCDASNSVDRAASHLSVLGARAIVGLTDSEQFLQVVRVHALPASMVLLSLAIAPDSVNSLLDADLAWLMALTVEQRTPLLETMLSSLEQRLRQERAAPLKLALMFRYDGAGRAGQSALREHELDGIQLGTPEQHAGRIRIDRYPDSASDTQALVAAYRSFAPDIIVMLGRSDDVTGFITQLERSDALDPEDLEAVRPHYLLTEAAQSSSLLEAARARPSLLERVHGVSATIPEVSRPIWEGFQRRYGARFGDALAATPRVAAAYDAVYALAYAIASIEPEHEVGGRIAQALHWLEPPALTAAPVFEVGPESVAMSFGRLTSGERIGVYGAAGELHWDGAGALISGAIEAWCLDASSGAVRFGGAPLIFDVASQRYSSRPASCDAWLKPLSEQRGLLEHASADMSGRASSQSSTPPSETPAEPGMVGEQPAAAGSSSPVTGPQAGAGGMMPGSMSTPADLPPATNPSLQCGMQMCEVERELCCVASVRPLGVPMEGDVSCQPRGAAPAMAGAAGAAAPAACTLSLQCISDADCQQGAVCCANTQLASCKTQAACDAELGRRLACKLPSECPDGQTCCLHMDGTASTFSFSACEAVCDLSNVGVRLCSSDQDCEDDSTANVCSASTLLPAVRSCRRAL